MADVLAPPTQLRKRRVSFAAAPCAIEDDDFAQLETFSLDAVNDAFAMHSLGSGSSSATLKAMQAVFPREQLSPLPLTAASSLATSASLLSPHQGGSSLLRRSRSTRIKEKHARILNESVAVRDSVVPDLVPPMRLPHPRSALHASDEDVFSGAQQRNSFSGRPASWCSTILPDACSTSSISSGSSDSPPDVSVVPRRCLRRWQNKYHLTELPYYHGVLPLADAGRLLMQPGVSVGTFILHFAPSDDDPATLQLFLSCLNAERHDSFVSHVVLPMDSFGIYLHQLRYPNVQALVLAARSQPLVEGITLGDFVPCAF